MDAEVTLEKTQAHPTPEQASVLKGAVHGDWRWYMGYGDGLDFKQSPKMTGLWDLKLTCLGEAVTGPMICKSFLLPSSSLHSHSLPAPP